MHAHLQPQRGGPSSVMEAARRMGACSGTELHDLEPATDMIFTLDCTGRITDANPAVECVLGYSPSELIGQPLSSILPVDEALHASERLRRKVVGIDWATVYEAAFRHKDGREVGVVVSTQTLSGRDGPTGVVAICREGAPAHRAAGRTRPHDLGLTPRLLEILQLVAAGKSTTEIAEDLFLSKTTVRNHIARILTTLGVHTRLQAVVEATRAGLLPLAPLPDSPTTASTSRK